jgi:hypothetical protein
MGWDSLLQAVMGWGLLLHSVQVMGWDSPQQAVLGLGLGFQLW